MKLQEFLSALANSSTITVVLKDHETSNVLAELKANGYATLEDTIEQRPVKLWTIVNQNKLEVAIGEAENNDPTGDP